MQNKDYKFKNNKNKKTQKSSIKSIILGLTIFFIITIVAALLLKTYYTNKVNEPNSKSTEKINFSINQGENLDSIIDNLVQKGLLTSNKKLIFKVYLKTNNLETKIQAGKFLIPKDLNIKELSQTLQKGGKQEFWIRVHEGYRKDQIAKELEKDFQDNDLSFSAKKFLTLVDNGSKTLKDLDKSNIITKSNQYTIDDIPTLEGFLFPNRYLVPIDADEEYVLELLLDEFRNQVHAHKLEITYEDVIIASMLEREGTTYQDKQIISDIIHKRLEEGWLLEIDATLLYPQKDWKHEISVADKEDDNPYNTYKTLGLPPTPICNPGFKSLKATVNPKQSNFYYYIHDPQGNPHYSKTYQEHLQNINKYLKDN